MPPFPRLLLMPHFWPQTWLHMLFIYRVDFKEMEASELSLASQRTRVKSAPDFTVSHEIHTSNVTFFLKSPCLTTVTRWRYGSITLSNNQQLRVQERKASLLSENTNRAFTAHFQVKPYQNQCCLVTSRVCITADFNYTTTCCSPHLFYRAEEQAL